MYNPFCLFSAPTVVEHSLAEAGTEMEPPRRVTLDYSLRKSPVSLFIIHEALPVRVLSTLSG